MEALGTSEIACHTLFRWEERSVVVVAVRVLLVGFDGTFPASCRVHVTLHCGPLGQSGVPKAVLSAAALLDQEGERVVGFHTCGRPMG